jgi:magnesium transporter
MLKYFIRRSGGEEFQQISTPPKEQVWIQADMATEDDLHVLVNSYDMDGNILRDVLDMHELPRIEIRDDAWYVFMRTAQKGKHGRIVTTPILLAGKGTVFASISTAQANGRHLTIPSNIIPTRHTASLLLSTFAGIVTEYEMLIQHTARSIHDTGQRLRTHEVTNDDFIRFVTVEDNLNEYKMNLGGMLVVAERLKEVIENSGDGEAIEDILLYIRQLLVAIDSYSQSITSIRNAYGTIANNTLNQRMKTLTVLTLLIALPNVFYGMYGMNINLPFQDEPWAYGAILLFTLLVILLVFIVARRKSIF